MELSHFFGSLVGLGLVLLASGLQRRVDAAYHLAVALLAFGAVLSVLRGFNYEEALILSIMLAALLPCRRYFYRRTSVIGERFTPGWSVAVVLAIAGSIWLGFFVHKHHEYSRELWWEFSLFGDAPRFLRASVGVVAGASVFRRGASPAAGPCPDVAAGSGNHAGGARHRVGRAAGIRPPGAPR